MHAHNNLIRSWEESFWPLKPAADYLGFAGDR